MTLEKINPREPGINILIAVDELVQKMCGTLHCEPNKQKCQHCEINLTQNNISFYHQMGWYLLVRTAAKSFYDQRQTIMEKILSR